MLDQLMQLVKEQAGDAIVNNPAIPNEKNNEAIQDVSQQLLSGLQSHAQQGNISDIVSMFKNGGSSGMMNNPMVAQLINKVAGSLASKFGISPQTATQIASGILPQVLSKFVNKTNDPNDNDFDLQDVIKNVSGNSNIGDILGQFGGGSSSGNTGGIGGMLGKMFGG